VNQETPTALEPKNQILAASLQRSHALAHELGRDHDRILGPRQPRVADLDPLQASPDDGRREPQANGLDLG
jgi:hypothetical protein